MPDLKKITVLLKRLTIAKVFSSHWCKLAFVLFFVLSYFLIPASAFAGSYQLWAVIFMISFSVSAACSLRSFKDRVKSKAQSGASFVSIAASLLGLSAIQFCSVNALLCSSTLGMSFLSMVLPQFFFQFFHHYAGLILIGSTLLQLTAIVSMGCLSPCHCPDLEK